LFLLSGLVMPANQTLLYHKVAPGEAVCIAEDAAIHGEHAVVAHLGVAPGALQLQIFVNHPFSRPINTHPGWAIRIDQKTGPITSGQY
jgi:hypothetical protein